MAFWVFSGLFIDDSVFGGSLDETDAGFLAFGDDEIANPGPYGDPYVAITLPMTGFYTVIVTNFGSDADDGDGLFPYVLTLNATPATVPVPAAGLLLMGALGGLAALRRRKALA